MTSDQFWSIFAMPIGLLICAGPMIIAWLVVEYCNPDSRDKNHHR